MSIRVEEYIRPDGANPYKTWFDSLEAQAAAKVVTAKLRMELGNTSSVKWFAGIGEYVIDWGRHCTPNTSPARPLGPPITRRRNVRGN
jgi:hypothetical protein